MNQNQKIILWIGRVIVALIGLFPPWNSIQLIATGGGVIRSTRSAGHAFILMPPVVNEPHVKNSFPLDVLNVEIDTLVLAVELVFTLIVIAGLVLVLRNGKSNNEATSNDDANLARDDA